MVRLHHDLIYAGEHPVNDAIPRPQAKVRKALTPLLEIRNLTKSFDGQHAVDDVSLTIYKGEIFALLGASGCGKSTLLRMLAGLNNPLPGRLCSMVSTSPACRRISARST
jgi:putrescine transport system ATP-binding protein